MSAQVKAPTTLDRPVTPSIEAGAEMFNTHPHRDPVVEALRILARRGQQVLEEEVARAAVAEVAA